MKIHLLLIAGLALILTACAKKEQETVEPDAEVPAAAGEPMAEVEEAVEKAVEDTGVSKMNFGDDAVLKHMHAHADKMDDINFALADDDLDAAMTPAYWLSRHETVEGIPEAWTPFFDGMREGARAVEASNDLESARAAAAVITAQCQGCHHAAGIVEGQ